MSISTKYKITKKDLSATLEAVKKMGFDEALDLAFISLVNMLEKSPEDGVAAHFLSWSSNLLLDARSAKNETDEQKFIMLSGFYRKLSHRLYWKQRSAGQIGFIKDFVQLVPKK